jgi:hypothetical protein
MKPIQKQPGQISTTLAVLGHHKCASTYIRHVSRTTSRLLGLRMKSIFFGDTLPLGYQLQKGYSEIRAKNSATILNDQYDMLYHGNASNTVLDVLEKRGKYRAIHLIRDPRDIIISGYFSHLYSHPRNSPWFREQYHRLKKLDDLEKGLLAEIDFDACYIEAIGAWNYANPNIHEMRFEKLIENPLNEFSVAFEFLGLLDGNVPSGRMGFVMKVIQLSRAILASTRFGFVMDLLNRCRDSSILSQQQRLPQAVLPTILWLHSFERKSHGRKRGQEDVNSHYRKGIAGDWRTYFTPKVCKLFKERYGNLLVKLNYEKDLDW